MKKLQSGIIACAALLLLFASCKKDEYVEPEETVITKKDTIRVTTDARSGHYTLYSLSEGKVIDQKDSATSKWDFGIRFVDFIVNSHSSGPGNAGVITQKGIFANYLQAPLNGYAYDTTANQKAINSEKVNGWYDYNDATHSFSPKAGMFFVFKTADNKYAKLEMLSATYEEFQGPKPFWIHYEFQYTLQEDGTPNFQN